MKVNLMKTSLLLICCLAALISMPAVNAQETTTVVETSSHNIFTGLFKAVWARLKSFNPPQKESANSGAVYTVGIRGAESTDTLLKPYWKDDLSQNKEFQAELKQYSLAQIKMDQGELQAAVESFDSFLNQYGQSNLRPNALFGKSLSLAGLGQKQQSVATMQIFIDENPNHPLVDDARLVITELG
jgi:tetratricopeptide (TPR) repeat protein